MNKLAILAVFLLVAGLVTIGIVWGYPLFMHTHGILLNYCNINEEMKVICAELLR